MSIRVGLIGLHRGVQVHLPAFKANSKYDLAAVCARTPGVAERVAAEHNVPYWYTDVRKLLAARLDLIAIASPPPTHAGYAAAALAAGKHVLLEVAYTSTAADARVLAEQARARGRVGAAAYGLRFVPTLRHVTNVLEQGVLGRLQLMHMDFYNDLLADAPDSYPWLWAGDHGGGIFANYLAHGLDLARRWFGPVAAVEATYATRTPRPRRSGDEHPAEDTGVVAVQFESGMLATFGFCAVVATRLNRLALHGAQGSLLVDNFGESAQLLSMGDDTPRPLFPPTVYLEETRGETGLLAGFPVLLDRLAAAITGEGSATDLPTLDEALEVQRVVDAARIAAREHRQVYLHEVG
ncbi:MAG: Gfo/Idh/MocA family oxidoreductase [Anaerolineales bacterium]|nr:Gfo/Idh/MocA family oxidoreductase [Anaerolineales bacterium]